MARESYVHGNSGPPLIGKTIGALLDEVSAADGSREALVVAHQRIRWTYSELKVRCDAFASGLLCLRESVAAHLEVRIRPAHPLVCDNQRFARAIDRQST